MVTKMAKLALTIFTILFFISSPVSAVKPEERVKVRTEYRHTTDTPNHLVFWMTLQSIQSREARNHGLAVQIVGNRFDLKSVEQAELMLAKMLGSLESLQNEQRETAKEMFCRPDRVREKRAIYRKMDALDDAYAIAANKHYVLFLSDLDESAENSLSQWLEERKKTFHYRTAEHESMFAGSGIDVNSHVDQMCTSLDVR